MKARVQRWDALWSITKRKRETRAKIVLGGAVLAEGRAAWITTILDRHAPRACATASPCATSPGLPLCRSAPAAPSMRPQNRPLKAIGDMGTGLDQGTVGAPGYRDNDEEEAFDRR